MILGKCDGKKSTCRVLTTSVKDSSADIHSQKSTSIQPLVFTFTTHEVSRKHTHTLAHKVATRNVSHHTFRQLNGTSVDAKSSKQRAKSNLYDMGTLKLHDLPTGSDLNSGQVWLALVPRTPADSQAGVSDDQSESLSFRVSAELCPH